MTVSSKQLHKDFEFFRRLQDECAQLRRVNYELKRALAKRDETIWQLEEEIGVMRRSLGRGASSRARQRSGARRVGISRSAASTRRKT